MRSDVERTYEYDNAGRVAKVKCGGKVVEIYTYSKNGHTVLVTDGNGNVTWGEGYIYGADGKRKATVDNTGAITLYSYNAQGQIETVSYPYTKEMEQKLKEEAELHNMTSMN